MGRRLKDEPKKKAREYWLEDINNRLARTSYAICKLAQIEAGIKLTDREIYLFNTDIEFRKMISNLKLPE